MMVFRAAMWTGFLDLRWARRILYAASMSCGELFWDSLLTMLRVVCGFGGTLADSMMFRIENAVGRLSATK